MWPFPRKKPLRPDKLPLPDRWTLLKGQRDGKPMFVRAHAGYQEFHGVAGFDHQVGIAVPFATLIPRGCPWESRRGI